jgi:hypothetical protein
MSPEAKARVQASVAKSVPAPPLVSEPPAEAQQPLQPPAPANKMAEAAVAAVQQGQSETQRYSHFREGMEKFTKAIWPNGPENSSGKSVLTDELYTTAKRLLYDINDLSKGKDGFAAMPAQALSSFMILRNYIEQAEEVAAREGPKYYRNSPAALASLKAGLSVQDMVNERPGDNAYGPVQTVLAMHSIIQENTLASHETQRLAFEAERKAYVEKEIAAQAGVKKAEEEAATHKRKYEEALAEAVKSKEAADAFEKELKVKRAKLEALEAGTTSTSAPSNPIASRVAAELGSGNAGTPGPRLVESAAASRDTTGSSSLDQQAPAQFRAPASLSKLFDPAPMYDQLSKGTKSPWLSKASDPSAMATFRFFGAPASQQ